MEVFVDIVTGAQEGRVQKNEVGGNTTMNETVIEAHARYLIEDRIHATHPRHFVHDRRRHRRLRKLSWL